MTMSAEQVSSALPRREPATHSRAGNGMARTREAALSGAVQAVAAYGARKATMGDIATHAGIAKATLYNHFRTRQDVYRAAIEFEVERIAAAALQRLDTGLGAVLDEAARLVADHPALRRIREEPAVLATVVTVGDTPAWALARGRVAALLDATGLDATGLDATGLDATGRGAAVDLVLRFLLSQIVSPAAAEQRSAAAHLLAVACDRC